MKPDECQNAKRLRYAQMVLFPIIILLLCFPYVGCVIDGYYHYYSGIDLMFNLTAQTEEFLRVGMVSTVFAILPIIGFFTAAFDRHRVIKGIVGVAVSFLGIFCITFFLKNTISLGAVLSIVLYLVTFLISVMLTLVKLSENRENKENGVDYISNVNRLEKHK